MKNILDLCLHKLNLELEEMAHIVNIDPELLKLIVCDMYLRGWKDKEFNKIESKEKMEALKLSLSEE